MNRNDVDGDELENEEEEEDEMEDTMLEETREEDDDGENDGENEIEGEENEDEEEDSHENTPRPKKPKKAKKSKRSKKKRKRSSSVESMDYEEEKIAPPLSTTNKQIKVGPEYQAVVPEDVSSQHSDREDADEKIWETPDNINDIKLLEFVEQAIDRFRYPVDRALYILRNTQFDFDQAIAQMKKRHELRDLWTDDEATLFFNCFWSFGKNFKRIQTVMPHRSMRSLVQYYYESKKHINYIAFATAPIGEDCELEDFEDDSKHAEKVLDRMCANCGEYAEQMEVRNPLDKIKLYDCDMCRRYFLQNKVRRPTAAHLIIEGRMKNVVGCPQFMKVHVKDYAVLLKKATGETYKNRRVGTVQGIGDITGVAHVNRMMRLGKENMDKKETEEEKPVEMKEWNPTTPFVWQKKYTQCMEENEVIAEDSRKKMFNSFTAINRVNMKMVAIWRHEIDSLRWRMDRSVGDYDLLPGVLCVEERSRHQSDWNDKDRASAIKCFEWYGKQFAYIADVIGNKTEEQIITFYDENKPFLLKRMKDYRQTMRKECEENKENQMNGFGAANEVEEDEDAAESEGSRVESEEREKSGETDRSEGEEALVVKEETVSDEEKEEEKLEGDDFEDSTELNKSMPLEAFGVTDKESAEDEEVEEEEEEENNEELDNEDEEEEDGDELIDLGTPEERLIEDDDERGGEGITTGEAEHVESVREADDLEDMTEMKVTGDENDVEEQKNCQDVEESATHESEGSVHSDFKNHEITERSVYSDSKIHEKPQGSVLSSQNHGKPASGGSVLSGSEKNEKPQRSVHSDSQNHGIPEAERSVHSDSQNHEQPGPGGSGHPGSENHEKPEPEGSLYPDPKTHEESGDLKETEQPAQIKKPAGQEERRNTEEIDEEKGRRPTKQKSLEEVEDELESGEEAGYDSQDDFVDVDDEEDSSEELEDSEEDPIESVRKIEMTPHAPGSSTNSEELKKLEITASANESIEALPISGDTEMSNSGNCSANIGTETV